MNPSDFVFSKGANEKLRVQIASIFGGMGLGIKMQCGQLKKKLIRGVRHHHHHHHHHCNNNHHHNHHPYFVYVTHQN